MRFSICSKVSQPRKSGWNLGGKLAFQFLTVVFLAGAALASSVPQINAPLVPASIAPGGGPFTLTVNGTGFVSGAVVRWNGIARTTKFVSSTQLTATIPAYAIATPKTASVTVVNPLGGGVSNILDFQVTGPTSALLLRRSNFNTGTAPRSVATADFNRDRKPDLAIANAADDTVSVLMGNGDGTFQHAVAYATGSSPLSVAVADFNKDGRRDLVVANDGSDTVSILLGNGDGTFQAHVDYPTGVSPTSVSVADFNGDGNLDLVVTDFNQDAVSILLGNGDGTFQPHLDYTTGLAPFSVAVGDFNHDGKLDLTTANYNSGYDTGSVSILLGHGDGTFATHVEYVTANNPTSVITADFNSDGKLDLALTSETGNVVSILLGHGDGTFGGHVDYTAGTGPISLTTGDFNGDGLLDLAAVNDGSSTVSTLLGNGDGTFQAHSDSPTGIFPVSVAAADFNGDGRPDLVVTNYDSGTVSVLMQVPKVKLSAKSLSFGNQAVGTTSPPRNVTLTNSGTGLLTITSIAVTGESSDFTQTNTCGTSVLGGANCTISVTFNPTQEGARTGYIKISSNAGVNWVNLKGTGLAPLVTWSPSSLTFAGQKVHTTSPPKTVTLTNTGNAAMSINSISTSGDFAETNTCPASLAAGASCTVNVTFTPQQLGTRNGRVKISSNAPSNPAVSLTGTGI